MAADLNKPVVADLYTVSYPQIVDNFQAQAKMFNDVTPANCPIGAIRYSSTNHRWEKYNGATWDELDTTYVLSDIPRLSVSNVFAGTLQAAISVIASGTFAEFQWNQTDGALDEKRWSQIFDGSNLSLRCYNDTGTYNTAFNIGRTGNVVGQWDLYGTSFDFNFATYNHTFIEGVIRIGAVDAVNEGGQLNLDGAGSYAQAKMHHYQNQITFYNTTDLKYLRYYTDTGNLIFPGTLTFEGIGFFGYNTAAAWWGEFGYSGASAHSVVFDFHTGASSVDYDTRFQFSGGTASAGNGTLNITSATLQHNSSNVLTTASDHLNSTNTPLDTVSSSKNASLVTLVSGSDTTITTVNIGTVVAGDVFLVSASAAIAKGATTGDTYCHVTKDTGTSTVTFNHDDTRGPISSDLSQTISATQVFSNGGIPMKVTSGGTLTVKFYGRSVGSNGTIAAGFGQMAIIQLYNA